jgi:uncharacterized protein (TIGR02611 family)
VLKLVVVLRFIRRSTLLLTVGLVGGVVVAAGVVMLVTPGPGLVVIVAGLAILSTQFVWAERALAQVKRRAMAVRDKASARRTDRRAAGAAAAASAGTARAASAGTEAAAPLPDDLTPRRQAAGSDSQATG